MSAVQNRSVKLTGELSLRQASAVCDQIRDALAGRGKLDIDCTGVAEIDISIVQLLIAAAKSAAAAGKDLSVRFPAGGPLDGVLRRAGFITPQGEALTPEHGLWARTPD